jgi:hypothetical protein
MNQLELFDMLTTWVETHSSEEMNMSKEELQSLSVLLSPDQFTAFLILKNVKRFGGIDEYMNDFFLKDTVEGTLRQRLPIVGVERILQIVSNMPVNQVNADRIKSSLARIKAYVNICN